MARRYPAELSMTAMMYFFGTLQTCLLPAFVSIDASEWKLKWDLELLNILFGVSTQTNSIPPVFPLWRFSK